METGSAVFIFIIIIGICYIIYDSRPSKYTKQEESFGGFMNRSLVRFEYEKSPLHTIVYGGTGTGKTYFIRQYLKLYSVQNQGQDQDQNQDRDQVQDQVQHQDQDQDQHQVQDLRSSFTDQVQDQRTIVIVCKDDRDWIDPESNKFYTGFNKCDINMITKNNMHKFQNCVIVLDDMGDRLNKDIGYYFTKGRHYNIQMIVMCHKPAQIINTARMSCDTNYLTTYNGPDLFKNFNEIYKCEHDFNKIISELNSNYYNYTDGMSDELRYGIIKYKKENTFIIISSNRTMIYDSRVGFLDLKALSLKDDLEREDINKLIAYMKPLMINATDRNVNHDNYQFYFNKLLTLNNIKIQNDNLTKEMIKGKGMKILSNNCGIIGAGLFIFNCFYPNSKSRNAGTIAMGASTMLSRVNTLVNVGYGEELEGETRTKSDPRSGYTNGETRNTIQEEYIDQGSSLVNHEQSSLENHEQSSYTDQCNCDFVNEEMGILNRKGGRFLNKLYINNEEFREEIINFVKDKKELDLDLMLDKRCKSNTLNALGNKYLTECITSKDNTKDLIEIMAKFYPVKD